MQKHESQRRGFLKLGLLGLGALNIPDLAKPSPLKSQLEIPDAAEKKLTIVCAGAHPGDPEFGCGATMAKYSDAGHKVIFLYLTRGEASDPKKTFAEMAALRTKEAEQSCRILGATPKYAGQIDGNTVLDKPHAEEFSKMLLAENPDLVFTQWPVDGHPDHQVTGMLALTAWVISNRSFQLYFYEVNTGSETMAFTPTDYVDITALRERKKEAIYAHKTQAPVETYTDYFKPLEEFRGLEAGVKVAEAFIHFKAAGDRSTIPGIK